MNAPSTHNDYKAWAMAGPSRAAAPDESTYLVLWQAEYQAHGNDLLRLALYAGMRADRLAWVFLAGYQSACRHAFPAIECNGWLAFAVSEDRSEHAPLPGVTAAEEQGTITLSGTKSWVAAVDSIAKLLVKADRGASASYWLLPRDSAGLQLESRAAAAGFLGDLSQGYAHLDRTPVQPQQRLDASGVGRFPLIEALYSYAAFCGHALGGRSDDNLKVCACDCLAAIQPTLLSLSTDAVDVAYLREADARAQDLLRRLSGNQLDAAGDWEEDQRLIASYAKGLQRVQP